MEWHTVSIHTISTFSPTDNYATGIAFFRGSFMIVLTVLSISRDLYRSLDNFMWMIIAPSAFASMSMCILYSNVTH